MHHAGEMRETRKPNRAINTHVDLGVFNVHHVCNFAACSAEQTTRDLVNRFCASFTVMGSEAEVDYVCGDFTVMGSEFYSHGVRG